MITITFTICAGQEHIYPAYGNNIDDDTAGIVRNILMLMLRRTNEVDELRYSNIISQVQRPLPEFLAIGSTIRTPNSKKESVRSQRANREANGLLSLPKTSSNTHLGPDGHLAHGHFLEPCDTRLG
jgi:hypothetical protein